MSVTKTASTVEYEVVRSRSEHDDVVENWQVEAIDYDNEGIIYFALFSGPDAKKRAEEYARFKNDQ